MVSVALLTLVKEYETNPDIGNLIRKMSSACNEYVRSEKNTIHSYKTYQRTKSVISVSSIKDDIITEDKNADELLEIILSTAENPVERDIIQKRIEGYNDSEIAKMRGVSLSYINLIRNRLENRFDLRMAELDA